MYSTPCHGPELVIGSPSAGGLPPVRRPALPWLGVRYHRPPVNPSHHLHTPGRLLYITALPEKAISGPTQYQPIC